jgi:GT2 family glycosyltransferase
MTSGTLLIIIPFRNRWDLTEVCLNSLNKQALPETVKLKTLLVDNQSTEAETIQRAQQASERFPRLNIDVMQAAYEFNFSKMNNEAYKAFKEPTTKWVFFLNNDIELLDTGVISNFINLLDRTPEVGVVGATLLYPDRRIQHIFAAPGVKIIAAHPLRGFPYDGQWQWFKKSVRPVAAVTGAAMMVRAQDFEDVGMFDEKLPTLGQDIILCLAIEHKLGKFSITITDCKITHFESTTKLARFPRQEIDYIYATYEDWLHSTKWYSSELSRWSERPLLHAFGEIKYPTKLIARFWQ